MWRLLIFCTVCWQAHVSTSFNICNFKQIDTFYYLNNIKRKTEQIQYSIHIKFIEVCTTYIIFLLYDLFSILLVKMNNGNNISTIECEICLQYNVLNNIFNSREEEKKINKIIELCSTLHINSKETNYKLCIF